MHRLRTEFRLALLTLFGATAVIGITPFAIYRFANGQPLAGTLDLLIVLGICLIACYAWRSGRLDRACLMLSLACAMGCVTVASLLGLAGALWIYPVLLGNFLLVSRGKAVTISVAALGILAWLNPELSETVHISVFIVTAIVVSLFAFMFASRTEAQHRQLEAAAALDPLTGAYNRRGMKAELDLAIEASRRNQSPLGLAVFDLDHFKAINDGFGHEAGDAVLVQFSDLVRSSTRKGDRFFRLGGEEFALLLPGADIDALRDITEHLRASVERAVRCDDRPVTISIGATPLAAGESASSWLSRADSAMYLAKGEGRNRVVVVDNDGEVPPRVLR